MYCFSGESPSQIYIAALPSSMAPANTMDDLDSVASRNLLLFGSGTDHDFVLKCGERSFKVHRSIISPQSAVLRVLCNGNWKVRVKAQSLRIMTNDLPGRR